MTADQPPGYSPPVPLSPSDERLWATLIHVGGILVGFIAPLVGYLVLKDRSPFVRDNARNALNFQITVVIGYLIGSLLIAVLIGLLVLPVVWVVSIVFSIVAAVASNRGEVYRYPLTIPIVK